MPLHPSFFVLTGLIALCVPAITFAHETHTFIIGNSTYQMTVGSLNEPMVVDDKSGVELIVSKAGTGGSGLQSVTGLEKTLKVEVSAAGKKKTMDLAAAWGSAGHYEAVFYPTRQTEYSYRFFGTINDIPVDLLFTCSSGGHAMHGAMEDTTQVEISEGVTRTNKRGSFGCPRAKEGMGFPDASTSLTHLGFQHMVTCCVGILSLLIGLVALGLGIFLWKKRNTVA